MIRRIFQKDMPEWISLLPQAEPHWDRCMQMLKNRNFSISCIAFSHNSNSIASAYVNDTIRIWDVATGECLQATSISENIVSLAFSLDSAQVFSVSCDGSVHKWQLNAGEREEILSMQAGYVKAATFSNDLKLLASAIGNVIFIWCFQSGEKLHLLDVQPSKVLSVALSDDNVLIASGSTDSVVHVWAVDSGACLLHLSGHVDSVYSLSFSSNSERLASASGDRTIRIWSMKTGECIHSLTGHEGLIFTTSFSRNMAFIISSSSDKTIRIWDAKSGECVEKFSGHVGSVLSVIMSDDSSMLASITMGELPIRIWATCLDVRLPITEDPVYRTFENAVRELCISNKSGLAASLSADRTMRLWSLETGRCLEVLDDDARCRFHSFSNEKQDSLGGALQHALGNPDSCKTFAATAEKDIASNNIVGGSFSYGFSDDRRWITCNGRNLLWLPFEYRPIVKAVSGSTVVSGCYRRVMIVKFESEKQPSHFSFQEA